MVSGTAVSFWRIWFSISVWASSRASSFCWRLSCCSWSCRSAAQIFQLLDQLLALLLQVAALLALFVYFLLGGAENGR
jgi:hypothetical protein